jgi:carbon monoxide dehydrogenase subunit G
LETKFESAIKVARNATQAIYDRLADMRSLSKMIPQDKVTDYEADEDSCRFTVDKIGRMGLRIVDRKVCDYVKYAADGTVQFNFNLWVQMKEVAPYDSRIKVTLKADLNPMMKMLVSKQIQKFVDMMADAIAASA